MFIFADVSGGGSKNWSFFVDLINGRPLTLEAKFGDNALLMNHESNLYSCFTKVIKIRFLKKISFADQLKVFSTYSQKAIKEKKDNEESNIHE